MRTLSRSVARILLAMGVLVLLFAPRGFSQLKRVTVEDLTRNSEVVAIGQVKNMTSEWDETGTRIRTKVLLSVAQFVLGSSPENTLTLYVPGGELDGVGEIYSHMPVFKRDEQVVVFAAHDKSNHYRVSAGQLGKFTVEKDNATGKAMVPGHASLEEFTNEIRATVERLRSGELPAH